MLVAKMKPLVLILQLCGNLKFWRKKIDRNFFLGICQFRHASQHPEMFCKFLFL